MANPRRFWDWTAARYARQPITDEAAYQRKLAVTREYLRPDMRVLEFGCGTGSTAIAHAPYVAEFHAIDFSAKMIEIARAKAAEAQLEQLRFEQTTLDRVDVEDASLDAVLGLSVLHLLEDREEAIRRVHRLLRPGGVFVSNTMCLGDSMKFFRFIAPIGSALGLLPLVKVFTRRELEQSLRGAGFEIVHDAQAAPNQALFLVARKAA